MLLELSIQNLALIDAVTISFAPGFNVMTGETGAGKSIVVDAVNLALGERGDRMAIQTGADRARVEALFDVAGNAAVLQALADLGIEAQDGVLTVSRELTATGRHICRVGGSLVPLNMLKQIAEFLLDMHGQHEHQSLLDTKRHLGFLDAFGDAAHAALQAGMRGAYQAWHACARDLVKLREAMTQREQRLDLLRFQLAELDGAHLRAGEEEDLEKQHTFFRNAEKITDGVERAFAALYAGEGSHRAAMDALREGVDAMNPLAKLDEGYAALHERLEELYYQLEDAAMELRGMRDGLEYDPANADAVEARLDAIGRLRRKYGQTTRDMLATRERIAAELDTLQDAEENEQTLVKRCADLAAALYRQAEALSHARRALAESFERRVDAQLADLGMPHARLRVRFEPLPPLEAAGVAYTPQGLDRIEFLLTANLGEQEKPLARIASGGELSRIMLALKSMAAETSGIPSMVFDEIDTGISGRMAQVVAEKMASLAKGHQVICVTHLPQIAAMADAQFLVEKGVENGKTRTHVHALDVQQRVQELARIVGGADPQGESSLQHARTLLREAEARKAQLRGA
ncbi:MAG: DNA repair protein RecN [Oscillospiraceae bacterium]|nr:DNA repair protein RecN [Oscillospiraceae bacterium]